MLFFYRLLFPIAFLFFIPGLIVKLIRRSGWKKTYWERFGIFSKERKKELKDWQGAIWIHAVSVGETNLALTLLKEWNAVNPDRKYIFSTTTTTGQEIARNKAPDNVKVIFCPIDFTLAVLRTLNLLKPSAIVIMETELWPNLILMAKKRGIRLALVNTRISDKSFGGYRRFRFFFAPLLKAFDCILAQTAMDLERLQIICPALKETASVSGNIKFDQKPPEREKFDYASVFGPNRTMVLSCSTHSPEEALHLDAFKQIRQEFPQATLTIVPRHAERGGDIEKQILDAGFTCFRRSTNSGTEKPDVLLADTTGELPAFIKGADIVLMGKTMAGNDEGQNIIEPALMGKPIISGPKLKNFRQALDVLVKADAVRRIGNDGELAAALRELLADCPAAEAMGQRAQGVILANRGALQTTVNALENLMNQ